MVTKDEALKMAIEWIEGWHGVSPSKAKALRACYEALEQPAQEPIETEARYYVQNKNIGYLGNAPYWWGKGGRGYTAYILGAERFTEADAKRLVDDSPSKFVMFKCDDVDARLHLVFDEQDFSRLGTNKDCGWAGGYATHPAPSWQGLSDDDIGTISDEVEETLLANGLPEREYVFEFARAIEQEIREKNANNN